jgi:hypothetical protein
MQMMSVEDTGDLGNYIPAFSSVVTVDIQASGSSWTQYKARKKRKARRRGKR